MAGVEKEDGKATGRGSDSVGEVAETAATAWGNRKDREVVVRSGVVGEATAWPRRDLLKSNDAQPSTQFQPTNATRAN